MPGKKKLSKKELMEAVKIAQRYTKTKPAEKKPVAKKKESILSMVKRKLGKLFSGSRYSRTKQTEEQLRKSLREADIKRLRGKKKDHKGK